MLWDLIGSGAAFLTMFGFVPQILKIYRTRSVQDVSGWMLLQFSLGIFLWLLYGLHIEDDILIVANAVSLATLIIADALFLRYNSTQV